ncbi:hypothetical protein [Microbacterium testaceum]|uniref:hypothetical protein n=1 Tax=Microbacterium testaceum TaxID=2033 RepID=UPI001056EC75|nr:hypothetical protein [Microbacterium testaceum]
MTDDQPRWKFRINARAAGFGQKTQYEAICPTCPDEWHRKDGCDCLAFATAFEARQFIRDANQALAVDGASGTA